ncbi:MAG TPA: LysM peptidoglycan-binding domain-containing protein [Tepidisphaeraceae bacterium]|nr:LysM peptidoglycan-binding domain-containing protein [Tepidisphaeraceae bacterium]
MTRETKIGLLVGLAFIIVIGILLSDHLTSSTEPPAAPISGAGAVVRSAVNTPVHSQQPMPQAAAPQVQIRQPVRAAEEFQPRPQPVKVVSIDSPVQQEPVSITSPDTNPGATYVQHTPDTSSNNRSTRDFSHPDQSTFHQSAEARDEPVNTTGSTTQIPNSDPVLARLNAEAARLGESVVPVSNTASAPQPAGMTKYKVQAGDSLSKIASKVYGTSNQAAIAAIVEANPSLKANPNLVIEGRTYNMPVLSTAGTTAAGRAGTERIAADRLTPPTGTLVPAPQASSNNASADSRSTYTVVDGDNLTRIAREQCGTDDAVAAIKELNRDLLKGGDVIRPGMKLRLPAKSVAVSQ